MRVESKVEGGRMEEKDRHGIDGGSDEVVAGKKGFALHPCLHRMYACREERRQSCLFTVPGINTKTLKTQQQGGEQAQTASTLLHR